MTTTDLVLKALATYVAEVELRVDELSAATQEARDSGRMASEPNARGVSYFDLLAAHQGAVQILWAAKDMLSLAERAAEDGGA